MEKIELNAFYVHEALHTTHLAASFVEENLTEHWVYKSGACKEFNECIDTALTALSDAYQAIGCFELESEVKEQMQHRHRLNNWRKIKRQQEQATDNKVALILGE